jgi:hypothetical protein
MILYLFCISIPLVVCLSLIVTYRIARCDADLQAHPYQFKCHKKLAQFERWHDHQIEQLGTTSNTLFALASAAFGYSLTLLGDTNKSLVQNHTVCFDLFVSSFAVSLILGLFSIVVRLYDFRWTAKRHKLRDRRDAEETDTNKKEKDAEEVKKLYKKTRRMGFWTWNLLYCQGVFFLLGGMTISYFWIANYT